MVTRIIKTSYYIFILSIILISIMGCTDNQLKPDIPNLTFDASMQENSDGKILISVGVCNTGSGRFKGDEYFNGIMELREADGDVCTQAEIYQFQALEHGESVFPLSWRGELYPGTYTLSWGAPAYGYTEVCFEISEYDGLRIVSKENIYLK
jgi:hypothetical protein